MSRQTTKRNDLKNPVTGQTLPISKTSFPLIAIIWSNQSPPNLLQRGGELTVATLAMSGKDDKALNDKRPVSSVGLELKFLQDDQIK